MYLKLKILMLSFVIVHSSKAAQHLICKQVNEIFSKQSSKPEHGRPTLQGPPGKMGPPGTIGLIGPRGQRGSPGLTDYKRVNSSIDEKINEALSDTLAEFQGMKKYFNLLKKGICPLSYQEKCFWVIIAQVTYFQGSNMCIAQGGKAANIHDKAHYDAVLEYVRAVMPPSRSYIELWLGMTMDFSTNKATNSDGIRVSDLPWLPGYPSKTASYSQICLQLRPDPDTSRQGIWNYNPNNARGGVLCEIDI